MKKNLLTAVVCATALLSCKHEIPVPAESVVSGPGSVGAGTATKEVCFGGDVLPIFTTNCAKSGCHDVATASKGYVLTTYNGIMNGVRPGDVNGSKIYRMITETDPNKRMPKNASALSASAIDLIKRWIEEGAKNTTNCK